MKKLLLLAIILALVISTALPVSAEKLDTGFYNGSGKTTQVKKSKAPLYINFDFVTSQNLNRDCYVNTKIASAISYGSTVTLEEGHTLTVYGTFKVGGKFINHGTVRVVTAAMGDNQTPGLLENKGVIENHGTIIIDNGNLRNEVSSQLINSGNIKITGDNKDTIYLNNLSVRPIDGVAQPGYIKNGGTILIANEKGMGFLNAGKLENNGTIKANQGATYKGLSLA